ncbi:hypothetical protein BD413DRAFT_142456 [Trametes elegans]|nr:hypothetical protein BD413DRAFT_142456 [Trametes elegans]
MHATFRNRRAGVATARLWPGTPLVLTCHTHEARGGKEAIVCCGAVRTACGMMRGLSRLEALGGACPDDVLRSRGPWTRPHAGDQHGLFPLPPPGGIGWCAPVSLSSSAGAGRFLPAGARLGDGERVGRTCQARFQLLPGFGGDVGRPHHPRCAVHILRSWPSHVLTHRPRYFWIQS